MANYDIWIIYSYFGENMLQVEVFTNDDETRLVEQINYFLKQIDEICIKDIKYSSFAFFDGKSYVLIKTALIIYLVK